MITRDGAHSPQPRTGREEHKASEGSVLRGGKRKCLGVTHPSPCKEVQE